MKFIYKTKNNKNKTKIIQQARKKRWNAYNQDIYIYNMYVCIKKKKWFLCDQTIKNKVLTK